MTKPKALSLAKGFVRTLNRILVSAPSAARVFAFISRSTSTALTMIHERARDRGVRILQEIITVRQDSAIEIPVLIAGPAAPVVIQLSDVLIVLLPVVIAEVQDQAVLGRSRVLGVIADPPVVVPVNVR